MQQEFYTSCMKINGIPILPPLMTDSIKEEMKHYRSLAVKVEDKLKARQFVKQTIKDKCVQANIVEPISKLKNINYSSDSDISNQNTTSDTNNSDSHSKVTIVEHSPLTPVVGEVRNKHNMQSLMSNVYHSQSQVCSSNDTINNTEFITTKIDQIECADATEMVMSDEDKISSESWKPEVPKTLNIVPITLSNPKSKENNAEDNSVTVVPKESENPPKLSRQGSYILDTPSPMLLAHMHTELTEKEYVPTPTVNVSQRKQWNIVQSKAEWENQSVMKDTEILDKLETTYESSSQYAEPNTSAESCQTSKSNNSIKTTFIEEHLSKSDITPTKYNHTPNTALNNKNSSEEARENNVRTLDTVNKFKESVQSVNSPEKRLLHTDENKHYEDVEDIKEHKSLLAKAKSSITPEKILTVYREIEEMHKKQMMELINRQQKEQSLLQAEFQKQQMRLLAEIQKCSSGIPYQVGASNISVKGNETRLGNTVNETRPQLDVCSPKNVHAEVHYNTKLSSGSCANVVVCPLDYIPLKNIYVPKHRRSSFSTDTSAALNIDFTRQINLRDAVHDNSSSNNNNGDIDNNSNCKSHDRTPFKSSTVNRQLFPLDSNTTHVPVLDTSIYHDKHIRAVNIINAYTRGFLVRRLMQTERVITLKKIYKEALHCMLKLHVDAPLNLAELNFLHRLQLQCDAASLNLVELFAQSPAKRMKVIAQDREIKQSRTERPTSARSYSFATQKTLARKNLKEFESTMTKYQRPTVVRKNIVRSRCQTWTSDMREKLVSPNTLRQSIRRSTSAGTVRKPWR